MAQRRSTPVSRAQRRVAPWRFIAFAAAALASGAAFSTLVNWRASVMLGFDVGALAFVALSAPLFSDEASEMRRAAKKNDGSRVLLLAITAMVSVAILVAVASELMQKGGRNPLEIALVIATLCLSWVFSNLVYAMHYAHLYYRADAGGKDCGGIEFPNTAEPDYWDFAYFASCLGMTFQTSDMDITSQRLRRTAMFHCLAAFVFNLGVIAFSINVLGGGS
ncbi:MAG: DUF1345 domain-containing protein [Sphingomonas sp.]